MRNWTEIPQFNDLDISESFILSWQQQEKCLCFEVEFVVCEGHPFYEAPTSNEWACFMKGRLKFNNLREVTQLPSMEHVKAATDANGEIDYGHFDTFVEKNPGVFHISGDMGEFIVRSEQPVVELNTNAT